MTLELPDLPAGLYRHFKGGLYIAEGYSLDANNDGRIVVSYTILEPDEAHVGPLKDVRTAVSDDPKVEAWWDHVHTDGTKCCALIPENRQVCDPAVHPPAPRFEYLGPTWEGQR